MSPWTIKGTGRPLTPKTKRALQAGRVRARKKGMDALREMASKNSLFSPTPALHMKIWEHVDECRYVEDGLDADLLHQLDRGVVYASSVGCCHEHPFEEITLNVIAAVERDARKNGRPPKKRLLPQRDHTKKVKVRKKKVPATRTGPLLTTVVAEMFPESREGRPLLEVVSSLFDS